MRTQRKIIFLSLCSLILLCAPCVWVFSELQWPLKEKTPITGTFGEFRKEHIHAGVDISTNRKIGLPVYASESGSLYRLKTQFLGFGKAVYIKLNDGKFLVYAHLDRFSPEIERIVKKAQHEEQRYEIDIHPKEKILINKGDLIGYSGDTGGVNPHLHIELRDPGERPINILRHGLEIKDNTPPHINGIALCDPMTTYCIKYYSAKNLPSEINISDKIGLAISTYDQSQGNKLGIYQIDLIVDNKLLFIVKMDIFSYDEFYDNFLLCNKDLYINPVRGKASNGVNKNKIYYHLFRAFNNKLPFYPLNLNGILDLTPGKHNIIINVLDHSGNKSSLQFNIISKPNASPQKYEFEKEIWFSQDKLCEINIKKEDLYYPIYIIIDEIPSKQKVGELIPVSKIYNVGPKEAVFKKATMFITPSPSPLPRGTHAGRGSEMVSLPSEALAKEGVRGSRIGLYRYENGKWKYMDKNIITDFAKFALFRDITPPSIRIISTHPFFRVKIYDNGSGLNYSKLSLFIDGKKVIAEYSVNKKELSYQMPSGKHKITCTAEDKVGNINKKEISLTR